ncbi:MAG: class I SAM-dependent methyltransferase [Alphaproteobacteria bacterium]|nr:class I SAM-dependent methyltransferase [Alphaproteobacteria bacterium]
MGDPIGPVADIYAAMLAEHGPTPLGVGWNGLARQRLSFETLCAIIPPDDTGQTINDLGCGYGALFDFLAPRPALRDGLYYGWDAAPAMIEAAKARIADPRVNFAVARQPLAGADWSFASGTWNIKLDAPTAEWERVVAEGIRALAFASRRGYAFNMLSTRGPAREAEIHLGDPTRWLAFCRDNLPGRPELVEDYGLPEFTIRVRLP